MKPETPPKKVNLGCGRKRLPDCVNVDRVAEVQPDVVHDLDLHPYPFAEASFDEVHAYDVIEHLADIVAFMREISRIARPGAKVIVTTPHFSCANAFTDPTHRHQLSYFSLDYFTRDHPWNFYGDTGFAIAKRSLIFHPTWVNKVVHRLANRSPAAYERRWAWMFPAWFLYFELTVRK